VVDALVADVDVDLDEGLGLLEHAANSTATPSMAMTGRALDGRPRIT
jgi:hypothetical protein